MANETLTSSITEFITEYNKKTLLPIVKHGMILHKLADKEPMPKGEGTSVVFRGRVPLDPVAGVLATTDQATDATPVVFSGRTFTRNLYELKNSVKPTRLLKLTDFNQLRDLRDIVSVNMTESIERHSILWTAPYFMHLRADFDSTNHLQLRFTATSVGTTTTTISTALTAADDTYGGNSTAGYLTCISRTSKNFGQTVKTSDFDLTGGTSENLLTHGAFPAATAIGDEFVVCIGTGLTTADVLAYSSLAKISALLKDFLGNGKGYMWKNPRGYGWKTIMSEYDLYDLKQDSKEVDWQKYNDKSDGFQDWRAGQIYSHDVMDHTVNYRESVAGAHSWTGAVYNTMVVGKHAITATELIPPHIVVVDKPDSGNIHGKLMWISWDTTYAIAVTNGVAGCVLMTVPSSLI